MSMSTEEQEDDWEPLSEAEMKVAQAKQERSNKISKIMGDYLLKGYKMLATSCDHCGCILLQDKQAKLYCVACNELEAEGWKDDPAVCHAAALSKIREGASPMGGMALPSRSALAPSGDAGPRTSTPATEAGNASSAIPSLMTTTPLIVNGAAAAAKPKLGIRPPPLGTRYLVDVGRDAYEAFAAYDESSAERREDSSRNEAPPAVTPTPPPHAPPVESTAVGGISAVGPPSTQLSAPVSSTRSSFLSPAEFHFVQATLKRKLLRATNELEATSSTEAAAALCCLVKGCADAMTAVQKSRIEGD